MKRLNLPLKKYEEVKGDVNAAKARLELIPNEINLGVSKAKGDSQKYTDAQIKLSEGRITSSVTSSLKWDYGWSYFIKCCTRSRGYSSSY